MLRHEPKEKQMEPIFNNDNLMLRLNAVHKIRKYLQRKKQAYASRLHSRCAFGMSRTDFDWCVKMLEVSGVVTVSEGGLGAPLLTINEAFANTKFYEPEEVIADAMGDNHVGM
jgi:hypothetical protein